MKDVFVQQDVRVGEGVQHGKRWVYPRKTSSANGCMLQMPRMSRPIVHIFCPWRLRSFMGGMPPMALPGDDLQTGLHHPHSNILVNFKVNLTAAPLVNLYESGVGLKSCRGRQLVEVLWVLAAAMTSQCGVGLESFHGQAA